MAGLQDSYGNFVDFVNYVVIRYLLANSARVKILTTITMQHITTAKGQALRDLISVIRSLFPLEEDFEEIPVKPILAKCKPKHNDNDIDYVRV